MMEIGINSRSQELNNILASAMKKDSESFKKNILTNSLFDGSGTLWEIECLNEILQVKFDKSFVKFCKELKKLGLKIGE